MIIDRKDKREKKNNSPILAIALIGTEVLLGGLAFLLLQGQMREGRMQPPVRIADQ